MRRWLVGPAWGLWGLLAAGCASGLRSIQVTKAQLPRGLHYKGELATALRWTDAQGEHLCAISVRGEGRPTNDKDDGQRTKMYLHLYQLAADSVGKGWLRRLTSRHCLLTMETGVVQRTLQVTDLNHDGHGEVWVMYYGICRWDGQRPGSPQLLMYQNDKLFKAEEGRKSYVLDSAFLAGPKAFRTFATRLWRREAAYNAAQKKKAVKKEEAGP